MSALPLAILLLLGQLPSPQLAEPAGTVRLSAESAELDSVEAELRAEGDVLLESGGLRLRADSIVYDLEDREASASGEVLLIDGELALAAEQGRFSAAGGGFSAEQVELYQKEPGGAALLLEAGDAEAARKAGRNALTLKAEHLEQIARGRYLARQLRISPCDCGGGTPSFEVAASSADVEPGVRALLGWPRIHLRGVPVLVLPALYLPLSSRKTGFLLPRVGYSDRNGFAIDQPFFLVLGRSYDLTLSAGYRSGVDDARPTGVRGPRGRAEFRYAPAEGTSGRLALTAVDDFNKNADGARRGLRGAAGWYHASDFGSGFGMRAEVNAVSDADYLAAESLLAQEAIPYLRSQAWADWSSANVEAVVAGSWYQNLTERALVPGGLRPLFGPDAPISLQRPVALLLEVPQTPIAGSLRGGLEAVVERYQPFHADNLARVITLRPDSGASGVVYSLSRLVLSPELAMPLVRTDRVVVEAYGRARGQANWYDAAGVVDAEAASAQRARAVAGVFASTELSRVWGEGQGARRHSIEPRIELRGLSEEWGAPASLAEGAVVPVDEFDRLIPGSDLLTPAEAQLQAVASVTNRLIGKRGEIGRVVLGQDVSLGDAELGDSFGRLALKTGYFSLGASARVDPRRGEFVLASASTRLANGRGDAMTVGFDYLRDVRGTDRMRAGLDELFRLASALPPLAGGEREPRLIQATLGLAWKPLSWLSLRYGATLVGNLEPPPGANSFAEKVFARVSSQVAGIGLSGDCDCWRFDLSVAHNKGIPSPTVGFLFELKNWGSIAG